MALTPIISVIIPTYNARHLIKRAVDSVLAQSEVAFEIIVVDDASTDGTAEFIDRVYGSEARLIVRKLLVNAGPAHARIVGLTQASGTWIAPLDADDAWRPDRLAHLL